MAIVLVCHFAEGATLTSGSIRIEVSRLPGADVRHEIVAMRQPEFLLPSNNLGCSSKFHQSRSRKIWRRRLIVIVHMRQTILIRRPISVSCQNSNRPFPKTFETPDGGLFCIARQGSAKGVFEPETATRSPAKRAYGVTLREGRHVVLWTTKVSEHLDGELAKAKLPGRLQGR